MKLNLTFLLILLFAYESLEKKKGKNGETKPSSSNEKKPKLSLETSKTIKKKKKPSKQPPTSKTTKGTSSGTTKAPVISTAKIPSSEECQKMNKTFTEHMPTCSPVCPGLPKGLCSTEDLGPGCQCASPFATNATGHCIKKIDCPIRSYPTSTPPPKNPCEKPWLNVECRSACPETCNSKLQADCLVYCLPSGCSCVAPYSLTRNGSCVLQRDCPRESNSLRKERPIKTSCTGNWTHGSGRDSCEKTCGSTVDYSRCMKQTIGDTCLCRFPFAINNKGECIHESDC